MPLFRKSNPAPPLAAFDPRRMLVPLSPHDPWTIADSFEGTQIFGATGSGKTSGSGAAIARAMLREGFGGLVLTAKRDERDLWVKYCQQTGRSESLLVFSVGGPWRFNFLDYELKRTGPGGGLTENLVNLFVTVLDSGAGAGVGGRIRNGSGHSGNCSGTRSTCCAWRAWV